MFALDEDAGVLNGAEDHFTDDFDPNATSEGTPFCLSSSLTLNVFQARVGPTSPLLHSQRVAEYTTVCDAFPFSY